MTSSTINTSACPLCQQPNVCAISLGQAAETCWCRDKTIAPALLEQIPASLQAKACVCEHCVDQAGQLAREIV